jgi:hypothetical protein
MANVVIDIAAQFTGKNAFKQAETASQKMEKSVAKLGKQLLGVFAAGKLIAFGKQAAKAFAADEKAARSLALALANTGNAFAAIEVEKFIDDLQRTTLVLDDELRPAFQTLLTVTGNVKKSQDGLNLALDVAAGTTNSLSTVTSALAKAYSGQTTALGRLKTGLDKSLIASGDMDQITEELSKRFSGQAKAAATGYAADMDRITLASENAKEIIGKDLLDAMQLISGPEGIGGATTAMEGLATQIGNVIYGIGVLSSKLNSLPILKDVFGALGDVAEYNIIGLLGKLGSSSKTARAGTPAQSPGQRKAIDKANADALKLAKTKNTLSKIDNDSTARKIKLTGDQLALQELEKKFDVERVGLYAALNQSTSDETSMRLLSLIAIHDQNTALAGMIKKANETENAFASLTETLRTVIRGMLDAISGPLAALQNALGVAPSVSAPAGFSAIIPSMPGGYEGFGSGMSDLGTSNYGGLAGAGRYGGGGSTVVVNVAGSVSTERDLVDAITQGIYNNQAAGIPINYSTVY